jgi:Fe2+ transport system protein FeoA
MSEKFQKGRTYEITGFHEDCPKNYRQKLLSMGFVEGARFYVKKQAPLNGPLQVEIQGYFVSMRQAELALIKCRRI